MDFNKIESAFLTIKSRSTGSTYVLKGGSLFLGGLLEQIAFEKCNYNHQCVFSKQCHKLLQLLLRLK